MSAQKIVAVPKLDVRRNKGITREPLIMFVEYDMPKGSQGDPFAVNAVHRKFKNALVPLGVTEEWSEGCEVPTFEEFGHRRSAWRVPQGTALDDVRNALRAAGLSVDPELEFVHEKDCDNGKMDPATGGLVYADGSRVRWFDENSDLSYLKPEARAHIERLITEDKVRRKRELEQVAFSLKKTKVILLGKLSDEELRLIDKGIAYLTCNGSALTNAEQKLVSACIKRAGNAEQSTGRLSVDQMAILLDLTAAQKSVFERMWGRQPNDPNAEPPPEEIEIVQILERYHAEMTRLFGKEGK